MAVVNIEIKYLEEKTKLKQKQIKEVLENLGFPAEIEEENFWIEITPNRPDCYLVQGIIRAINSFIRKKNKRYTAKKSEYKIIVDKSVEKIRPYISSCVVKNLKISDEELEQLIDAQEKMHETMGRKRKKFAVGIHDLDSIEFPVKYSIVGEYQFIPLEFNRKLSIKEILEKHPKGIEYNHLVKKGKYPLIYEEKSGKVISFPPIINEERTKLSKNTKNIFIELTGMHKETVENGVSMLVCALIDMGGEAYEVKIGKENHPKLEYKKEKIKLEEINKLLGKKLKKSEIIESLEKMGYFVGKEVEIPPYRADIIEYVDLIEDVAIGHGYDNFKPTIPGFFSSGSYCERTKREDKLREIMNGMGFLEIVTLVLTRKENVGENALKIINPCTLEVEYIRENLFNSLLGVLEQNKMKGLPQKIYEVGVGYENKMEKRLLGFLIMDKKVDFNLIRSYAQTLMKEQGNELKLENEEDNRFGKGRCGKILGKCGKIGLVGEISKELLEKRGIEFEVGYFEIDV